MDSSKTSPVDDGSKPVDEKATRENCGPCLKKDPSQAIEGRWYCQQCDDVHCHECKSLHKIFKATENHLLVDLHPPCDNCEESPLDGADFFCNDCPGFLCGKCKSYHNLLKSTRKHAIEGSLDKVKRQNRSATSHDEDYSLPFSQRKATFESTFNVQIPGDTETPQITGSAFLPDSRLLLVDNYNNKLKIFDQNFRFIKEKKFGDGLYDVAVFDSNEMAVTAGRCKIVRLNTQGDMKEIGTVPVKFASTGVAYISKEKLGVTCRGEGNDMFCVYNIKGEQLSKLSLGQLLIPCHVEVDMSLQRAYVSTDVAMSAIDLKTNTVLFTYNHEQLSQPNGMTVDQEGNIYVCGLKSHNIHQVSPDGKCIQVLLSEKDRLNWPLTMAFSPKGNTFVIGSDSLSGNGKIVQVYKMQ